jgi:hypothetical protein
MGSNQPIVIKAASYEAFLQFASSAGYANKFSRLCYHVQQDMLWCRVIIKLIQLRLVEAELGNKVNISQQLNLHKF